MLPVTLNGIKMLPEAVVTMTKDKNIELDEDENCPACSSELLMGCCITCGECYEPNP